MRNKKLFAILTLVCFMFTLMPVAAFADTTTTVTDEEGLKEALEAGGEVALGDSFEVSKTISIPKGTTVTLDLKGQTITGKDNATGSFELILNHGTFTVIDSVGTGAITLTAANDRGWSSYSAVVSNMGTMNISGGTLEHLGGTAMAYAIDNRTNVDGYTEDVTLSITGGTIDSTYFAIRQFANSTVHKNTVTITDGEVGYTWIQNPNSSANKAEINITGGEVAGTYVKATDTISVNINPDCITDIGYMYEAKIGDDYYATLADAIDAAGVSDTVTLLTDIELTDSIEVSKKVTIDLVEYTISLPNDTDSDGVFYVISGGDLTLNGEGTVDGNTLTGDYNMAIWANGGKVTINGGTYTTVGAKASDSEGARNNNEVIYVKNGGAVIINGGTFKGENPTFTLNSNDSSTGTFEVKGGTFYGYNPAASSSENPVANFVADSYSSVQEGNNWTVYPNGISLSNSSLSLKVGKTSTLSATLIGVSNVTWTSSDESVATVDENGVVTAKSTGIATITATSGSYTATCVVTVSTSSSSSSGFTGSYNYPVNVDSAVNCDVELSDEYAIKGETVTITVTPDSGKKVKSVIVTDEDGEAITVTKVAENKYTFVMPEGEVDVVVLTADADYDSVITLQIGNKNVVVDGTAFRSDVAPFIQGDRTYVPIRVIIEALGGTADWDADTRTVTLTIDGKVLKMVIDQIIPNFDAPAIIVDGRTYVPVRYVSEAVGCQVDWYADTQQVVIQK